MSLGGLASVNAILRDAVDAEDLAVFKELVRQGGEVDMSACQKLLNNAHSLAFARVQEDVVGVGGIKRPFPAYRARVFHNARVSQLTHGFEFELGWLYVEPAARHQGIAGSLVEALLASLEDSSVYATSSIDNPGMHVILERFGFKCEGDPYPSKGNDHQIQLFLRPS